MTAEAHRYDDLHHLVDQLAEEQVDEARAFMLSLVDQRPPTEQSAVPVRRRLSFIGTLSAEPDLAERSEEILEEIVRRNAG